jgi:hypothetical protein
MPTGQHYAVIVWETPEQLPTFKGFFFVPFGYQGI